jgi:hypothetical protein
VNEHAIVSLIGLVGFLILAGSALAGHRLSWRKGVVMALAWAAIFLVVFLFIGVVA